MLKIKYNGKGIVAMNIYLGKNNIKEKDYNFVVSNFLLSKKGNFTHEECINELNNIFNPSDNKLEIALSKALVRLRNDGFLDILGPRYTVKKINI